MPNGRTSRASLHVPLNHFACFHLWNMMLIPFLLIAKWPVFLCNSVAKKKLIPLPLEIKIKKYGTRNT